VPELAIQTDQLSRSFGEFRALDALDLGVPRGALFALLGPNGAGKSTTIKILTTLLAPTSGRGLVAGFDVVTHAREVRRRSGVVFQESSLDDRLTARENLMLHVAVFGVLPGLRAARVADTLAWIGLSNVADQLVRTFSGGMRRRLEIARALTHEPEVVVLDEPTVGLDPQTRRVVWEHLGAIAATRERTVFVTTHYMDEAERCDDVAIIDHGKLIAHGSPQDLVGRLGPEKLFVKTEDDKRTASVAAELGLRVREADVQAPGRAAATPADASSSAGLEVEGDRPEIMLAKLAERGLGLREARILRLRLEDAFVALTGRDIRDEPDDAAGNQAAMRTRLRARGRSV
jgi:ABC-2 type transport system ATP-binding protein